MDRIRVVAITGDGRSGSTILDNVLGATEGFVSVGELRFLWQRSLLEHRLCGCGHTVFDCELWPRVFATAYGGFDAVDPVHVASLMGRVRTRYAPAAAIPWLRGWYRGRLQPLVPFLEKLYPAIAEVAGSRVVVDSSKVPTYTYLLSLVPSIDLHVVHLVRDPRAVVFSNMRSKRQLDTAEKRDMTRTSPGKSAFYWALWNTTTRSLFKDQPGYTLLRYEDLVASPEDHVRRLLDAIGEPGTGLPFVGPRSVALQPNHTVSGNPSRFATGTVTLRLDEAWRREMTPRHRRIASSIAAPFLKPYGYAWRGR